METRTNKLSEIDKRNPFSVPEHYFDNINSDIMKMLPHKEPLKPQKVSMWDKTKPWVYMAAMFAGIFFSIQLLTKNMTNRNSYSATSPTQVTDDYWSEVKISEEDFYQYLEDQLIKDGYYDYMYRQTRMN